MIGSRAEQSRARENTVAFHFSAVESRERIMWPIFWYEWCRLDEGIVSTPVVVMLILSKEQKKIWYIDTTVDFNEYLIDDSLSLDRIIARTAQLIQHAWEFVDVARKSVVYGKDNLQWPLISADNCLSGHLGRLHLGSDSHHWLSCKMQRKTLSVTHCHVAVSPF